MVHKFAVSRISTKAHEISENYVIEGGQKEKICGDDPPGTLSESYLKSPLRHEAETIPPKPSLFVEQVFAGNSGTYRTVIRRWRKRHLCIFSAVLRLSSARLSYADMCIPPWRWAAAREQVPACRLSFSLSSPPVRRNETTYQFLQN